MLINFSGDEDVLSLWRRFRSLSIKAYEEVYKRLNVRFDVYAGESLVKQEIIQDAMRLMKEKGLITTKSIQESRGDREAAVVDDPTAEQDEGTPNAPALAVDLNKWKMGKPVVQKGGGSFHFACLEKQYS